MQAEQFKSQRWNVTALSLGDGNRTCTCCDRDLSGHAVRMLELDQRIDAYHDFRNVPENNSQGWFPFGLTCARKEIDKAKAAFNRINQTTLPVHGGK